MASSDPASSTPTASFLRPLTPLSGVNSLELSRWMLFSMGINIQVHHAQRLPRSPYLLISNHRSFLDAPLLMAATAHPVHFACHHYMSQVPVMKHVVEALGCFPLDGPKERGRNFFKQATHFLRSQQSIGIFPEGTTPMVAPTAPTQLSPFHRGFAHLALRAPIDQLPIDQLQIVPAAVLALEEHQQETIPFKLLGWFDPSEPLFQQNGLHPAVFYRRVAVVIGEPITIVQHYRQAYQGRQASQIASELTATCHEAVRSLLQTGCY